MPAAPRWRASCGSPWITPQRGHCIYQRSRAWFPTRSGKSDAHPAAAFEVANAPTTIAAMSPVPGRLLRALHTFALVAILAGGKVVRQGAPEELRQSMQGQVWRASIAREDLEAVRQRYSVISERLLGGRTMVHVLSPTQPSAEFAPVEGGLEDVYFSTLAAARAA